MKGHKVVIHDANPKAGGLNEYGIATYKSVDQFAQHEVDYVTAIGGISIVNDSRLGDNLTIDGLLEDHHATRHCFSSQSRRRSMSRRQQSALQ